MYCYTSGDFNRYWEENMKALGMWVPSSSYEAFGGLAGLITTVATAAETNAAMPLRTALLSSPVSTIGGNVLAVTASAWAGAAIGSFAVAAGRSLSCGSTLADALWLAREKLKIYGTWVEYELRKYPQLFGSK